LLAVAMGTALALHAARADNPPGDAVVGTWTASGGYARIAIERCGDAYCGSIVWLKDPVYPSGSRDGVPGEPKRDDHNPDPALTPRPLVGLRMLEGFRYRSDDATWAGGSIYDPEKGSTYSARMRLGEGDRLELRGYVGIPLFGRTTTWTRAPDDAQAAGTASAPKD
jgi:uncharacterized protein (DUF2147 family)